MNQQNHLAGSLESPFGSRAHSDHCQSKQCQSGQTAMALLLLSPVLKLCKTNWLLPPGKGCDFMGLSSCSSNWPPVTASLASHSASQNKGGPMPQCERDQVLDAEKVEKTHRKIIQAHSLINFKLLCASQHTNICYSCLIIKQDAYF